MDPGDTYSLHTFGPLLAQGPSLLLVAAVGTVAAGMGVSVRAKRRVRRWAEIGASLGMPLSRTAATRMPTLRGVYRDRAVESLLLSDGRVRVSARIANPLHLMDRFSARDLQTPSPSWLTVTGHAALVALSKRKTGNWQVTIDGNTLTITTYCSALEEKSIQSLIYLTCELAVGVDSSSARAA